MRVLPIIAATSLAASSALADTKQYDFDDFTYVDVSAGIKVTLKQGQDYFVEAEAIRGNLRRLEFKQSGDTLDISRKTRWSIFGLSRRDKFEVTITIPDFYGASASSGSALSVDGSFANDLEFDASSGASVAFTGSASGDFEVDVSSGASFAATGLSAKTVVAEATSGASLSLDGTCEAIDADAGSGASLSARNLECVEVDAQSGGGASLSVYASERVKASASGGASLSIHGSPKSVQNSANSSASISIR